MFKNVAGQSIAVFAFNPSTGAPVTGDAANIAMYISKDGGASAALATPTPTEIDATHMPGWYKVALAQAETNCDMCVIAGKSTTSTTALTGQFMSTLPPYFTSLGINSGGSVSIQGSIKKNAALVLPFLINDNTNHLPKPGLGTAITVTRDIDGTGSFSAISGAPVAEVGNGIYTVALAAADTNGGLVTYRMSASGSDDTFVTIAPLP